MKKKSVAEMTAESAILQYWNEIDSGGVNVGKWIRLLYEVIIQGLSEKRWFYDHHLAENAITFIERYCHHYKGKLAPQRIRLSLWERASISLIFGIVDATGKRQFVEVFWSIGRKMGKTLLAAGIATYMAYAAGEFGSEIYFLAPKLDQSDLCYSAFEFNVHAEEELDEITKSTKYRGLMIGETNTWVKKLAFSSKKSDGFNPMFYCADEAAAWPGVAGLRQWEVMVSGTGARVEPITLAISTGGYENDGIYDELFKRGTRFLLGESSEKHLLPIFYMIDDPEKWDDINELRKSLPGMGESIPIQFLLDEIDIARSSLSKKTEFLCKYCNLKQSSALAWLPATVIQNMYGNPLILDDFKSSYCVAGIDLSQTTDLTAATVVIEKNGELYVFAKFWLPSEKIEEAIQRDGVPYNIYIQRGLLELSGENFVDYHDCYQWLVDLVEQYEILPLKIGYDRYSAQYLIQDLNSYGFQCDDVYQGDNLWGVLQEMEGMFKDGNVHIGDNDLLKIHLLNSAIKMSTERGRGRLIKLNATDHIDGVAALADAFCVRQKWFDVIGEQLRNET